MTSSPDYQPRPRPDIVQALFSALIDMNPGELAKIAAAGITPAERRQAEDLYTASIAASLPQRERFAEAMRVLIGDRKFPANVTWQEMFDTLTPQRAETLRGLYDALPDGGRAEWDRRYGKPEDV